jgi:hypothetical protein
LNNDRLPGLTLVRPEEATMTAPSAIDPSAQPSGTGCVECDAAGGWWVHLRRCATCGHIGCCDSSPQQHARKHAAADGHAVIQSFEPGESWFWNFDTDDYADGPRLADPQHHPLEQTVPGPAERVPSD